MEVGIANLIRNLIPDRKNKKHSYLFTTSLEAFVLLMLISSEASIYQSQYHCNRFLEVENLSRNNIPLKPSLLLNLP